MSVHRFFGLFCGAIGFFNVMMQKFYFVIAAVLLHKVDLVMLPMQKEKKFRRTKRFAILLLSSA